MNKPKIYLTCANIASGKTTWAKKKAKEDPSFLIFDMDSIVTMLHGDYLLYSTECKPIYDSIEFHAISKIIKSGKNVIVDRLNHMVSRRAKYVDLASELGVTVEVVLFPRVSPEEHATRRFNSENRGYTFERWLSVAEKIDREWQEPSASEGVDLSYVVDFDQIKENGNFSIG